MPVRVGRAVAARLVLLEPVTAKPEPGGEGVQLSLAVGHKM